MESLVSFWMAPAHRLAANSLLTRPPSASKFNLQLLQTNLRVSLWRGQVLEAAPTALICFPSGTRPLTNHFPLCCSFHIRTWFHFAAVSWQPVAGLNVANYEVYADGVATPTTTTVNPWWTMAGLSAASTHSFRVCYLMPDGRRSPLSASTSATTMARS
jgi:hypothetical protein